MRLVGLDPGLRSFGAAKVEMVDHSPAVFKLVALEVWRTEKTDAVHRIRKADDTAERCRYLARKLLDFCADPDIVAICCEAVALPFVRMQTSVISALGRVRGLVDAVGEMHGIPVLEETPQGLKRIVTGDRTATKERMIEALIRQFPEAELMMPSQTTLHEHAADAGCSIIAGLQSDVVRAVLRAKGAA